MAARYHLRFQLRPGADLADRAATLAKVCVENAVDEVVLLLGAEQLYTGYLAGAGEDSWYEAVAEARTVLTESGLDVSLNPWVSVGHADRGRVDAHGFAPMVSPSGQPAAAQASFACPRWRDWLYAHYGRFARLGFRVLWVEDDFRYHNHAPLDWGGGFEPLMLERLAHLAGEPVTREQAVAAITAPGPPHPVRALLQQVWHTAQQEVADGLARAVQEHSGGRSRLGLMSSRPAAHSTEGRDWGALFTALSTQRGVTHRPHFAPYTDTPGRHLTSALWSLELQRILRPRYADCEPEIENWPHTAWSKSDTQTWSEMVTAQLSGADALLLNVHPTNAEHADRFPRIDRLLRLSRPALDWLAAHGPERGPEHVAEYSPDRDPDRDPNRGPDPAVPFGIGLPWRQDAAARLPVTSADLKELEQAVDPAPTADFLLGYGVPVTAGPAPVQALFGRLAHAYDDEEIRTMLRGGLLLDGTAATILTERGFAHLIGVRATLVDRSAHVEPGPYAVEAATDADADADAEPSPDAEHSFDTELSVDVQPALARLDPLPGTHTLTGIRTPDGRAWGAGRCHYTNARGGRVAVLPATTPADLPRSDEAQRLLHLTVRFLEGGEPRLPLVSGAPHLIPYATRSRHGYRLAVANGSADEARPRVDLPEAPASVRATVLAPLADPAPAVTERTGGLLQLGPVLPPRGWAVLDW